MHARASVEDLRNGLRCERAHGVVATEVATWPSREKSALSGMVDFNPRCDVIKRLENRLKGSCFASGIRWHHDESWRSPLRFTTPQSSHDTKLTSPKRCSDDAVRRYHRNHIGR